MTETVQLDFQSYIATAHALAERAGEVILPHFRTNLAVDDKGAAGFDPVTAADRDAEAAIREILSETHPGHGVVGEEFADTQADAEFCWIIDPIDGTRAFIMGQPLWGTLIGLTAHGAPVLGMMNQPYTGERFWCGETESYFTRAGETRPIRVRPCPVLDNAILASTAPELFDAAEGMRFEALSRAVRLRRFGGDCYNYCLLAMGQIDLVVESGLKPFDILPLVPIIERAGGIVTTWDGGDPGNGGRIVAAGDRALHAAALEILSA
ncbi:histidinol-phosphatase [Methyloceanibacter caenitepidi]|uniref:Histidinol-phosphatase n=1 Tax=Methyloceanibacter caenitepidi TaxID=1384459 RepID=A0A0A8K7M2_9HYPH|nr:histidinol-phosphatase [Methyloceanibacter caenitepidi]BAQ18547.1 histidinol-phosphatase [alternative form] [Methyloceanibacter caenitepidi]